jgi:hypothetical protein
MSPAAASCEEKMRLRREHMAAKSDYSRAVTLLNERSGTMFKHDYDTIRMFAEKTKGAVERTRIALEKHIAEHGC